MKEKLILRIMAIAFLFSFILVNKPIITFSNIENQIKERSIQAFTPHEPITITNDANFTDYGIPGYGTDEEPYIIENFNITSNEENSISINGTTKHFIIRNCYLHSIQSGLFIDNVSDGTASIVGCFVISSSYGFRIISSNEVKLTSNILESCSYRGIYLADCPNATLRNNIITDSYYAIRLDDSSLSSLNGNICENNYDGIYLDSSPDSIMTNNTCDSNYSYGIFVDSSSDDVLLTNNTCNSNLEYGIGISYSSNTILNNNTCNNNGGGIVLVYSVTSTLINNTCNFNSNCGIELQSSTGSTLSENVCNYNNYGINLDFYPFTVTNIILTKNMCCYNNKDGIRLYYFRWCLMTYNHIEQNVGYGISLEFSSNNNTLHHNYFLDNNPGGTSQASDSGESNIWYEQETNEGNYWSDWQFEEPYTIDGTAKSTDPYPLIKSTPTKTADTEASAILLVIVISVVKLVSLIKRRKKI